MNPVFKSLKRITVSYEKLSVFGSLPATNLLQVLHMFSEEVYGCEIELSL